MDDTTIEVAKIVGAILGSLIVTIFGNKLLNRTADKGGQSGAQGQTTVEDQFNLRIKEKDAEIKSLREDLNEVRDDLEKERLGRMEDRERFQKLLDDQRDRYETQLDDLRERFEEFRRNK